MNNIHKRIYTELHRIYDKHRRKYKPNPDSKQMCCMWSISRPPDVIEGTTPFCDIEDAFNISIDEDECFELYDMTLEEATSRISNIIKEQC